MIGLQAAYFASGFGLGGLLGISLLRHRWKVLKAWENDLQAREIRASKLMSKGDV
jgi:hypothetical protein